MIWTSVTIPGFEHYVISTDGEVINTRTLNRLKGWYNEDGYQRLKLTNVKSFSLQYVHRLVALAFIPKIEGKPEVHHKDDDRKNNKKSNLAWVTHQENIDFIYNHGSKKFDRIETGPIENINQQEEEYILPNDDDLPF